ncbi:MAG: phage terminase large subunit [Lachnospiraceae bacterium]|nr:phage terminase large subunit [Lachnospiraceae bacterium]
MEWKWKEVAVPALDPITDESNWEIYRKDKKGLRKIFTTDYYRKERKLVSEETWAAEFQQEPFEAKGRMFPENELNYFEELPLDKEPDAIMAACDSADKGDDSCAMPIGYVYGHEVYIVDVVFDNVGVQFTKPECANMLITHNVKTVTFESNGAGEYFGRDVMEIVKEQGGRSSARYKFNCSNKITRMENARDNIIRDYYFRDFRKMDRSTQYYKFMKELTTMTRSGKVRHDDAPDSLALFENEMRSGGRKPTIIMPSPI